MSNRNFWIAVSALAVLIAIVVPWQVVHSNGTGDGLYDYFFIGYGFLFAPPALPSAFSATTSRVGIDVLIVSIESTVLAGTSWLCRPSKSTEKWSVVRKTIFGLTCIGILFCSTVSSMAYLAGKLGDLNSWTIHTYQVLGELKDIRTALAVLPGDRSVVDAVAKDHLKLTDLQQARSHLSVVKQLTVDNIHQQHNCDVCADLIDRVEKNTTANQPFSSAQVNAVQDSITKMEDEEAQLLGARKHSLRDRENQIWVTIAILIAVTIGSLVWIGSIVKLAIELLEKEIQSRLEAERQLQISAANLMRSNEELQQFAYIASHDLQEPLRAVTGFMSLLRKKYADGLDDDARKYITFSIDGAERMRALISDLLKFARIETKGQVFQPVNLTNTVKDVEADLGEQISESKAKIEIVSELPTVTGDATQLRQLIQNLFSNAMKFRGENPPVVKLSCERQDEHWLFQIKDNGRGFEMAHAERIFVIFQRLQSREQAAGTGIGLALCKKIVERHGGKIWAESTLGEGSSFFFTLNT